MPQPTKDVKSVMDIARKFQAELNGESPETVPTAKPQAASPEGKSALLTPTEPEKANTEGISAEELALFKGDTKPGPSGDGDEAMKKALDAKVKEALKGLPYDNLEDTLGGYKNLQKKLQEVQDKLKTQTPEIQKALIRKELDAMLGKQSAEEAEAKKLKELEEEDPDAAKLEVLNIAVNKRMTGIETAVKDISEFITKRKESDELDSIREDVRIAAEKAKLPYKWLLSIATTEACINMPIEDVVPIARKELADMLGDAKLPEKPPVPARAPDTRGSAGTVRAPITVDDLGEPGSKQFTEVTIPKMVEAFMLRHKSA